MKQVILLIIIFTLYLTPCLAQTKKSKKLKSNKSSVIRESSTILTSEQNKKEQEESERLHKESSYYAPIRYVIVYNDIFKLSSSERRMDVLIDE